MNSCLVAENDYFIVLFCFKSYSANNIGGKNINYLSQSLPYQLCKPLQTLERTRHRDAIKVRFAPQGYEGSYELG